VSGEHRRAAANGPSTAGNVHGRMWVLLQ
jgi:hypothetical protein